LESSDCIYIYTDASFSKANELAIVGNACFKNSVDHNSLSISDIKINLFELNETNNIRAEIRGALMALKSFSIDKKIILYTDCQTLINLPSRRYKLTSTHYVSRRKQLPLTNALLYQEFYAIYDTLNIELVWIKGHAPHSQLNPIQSNFSYLDKEVRKYLRKKISDSAL
jgi:ribonuclease HI